MISTSETADLLIVGAGAAGLATAIFTARAAPHARVRCIDGARRIGAKILVSGGSRCNVTNREVSERDFWGSSPRAIRGVLRAFPARDAARFFESLGVALHEEEDGKLFPDSHSSRTVLAALLGEAERLGVEIISGRRVLAIDRERDRFVVAADGMRVSARTIVLATGGRSLPKTGSDGFGYQLAAQFGHRCVDTTPALAPLILEDGPHAQLSGISHRVVLTVRGTRLEGALLWTHFGISGPVALNASRHWHRARLEGEPVDLMLNVCPGETFESLEAWLLELARTRPKARLVTGLGDRLPAAVASAWLEKTGIDPETTPAHLSRGHRRALVHALLETRLVVRDSRGYNYAEVTAGGIALDEIETGRMESKRCPGLFLVGEIVDVDGRLGGFNFQWAWSSAWVAAQAIARAVPGPVPPR